MTLSAEAHHRIANNLALFAWMITIDARGIADANARRVLEATSSRIHAVASIHRRLFRAERSGLVDLQDYLEELGKDLAAVCHDVGR